MLLLVHLPVKEFQAVSHIAGSSTLSGSSIFLNLHHLQFSMFWEDCYVLHEELFRALYV